MRQAPLLELESSVFVVTPGEDEHTNPGIHGKPLAQWLAEQLRSAGFPAEGGVMAREFGRDASAESLSALFAAVRRCLESAPHVRGLREEST